MDLVPILKTAVAVPVLGSFLVPVADKVSAKARNAYAVLLGLVTFAASAALLPAVAGGAAATCTLAFPLGFDFVLSADMLSVFMAAVASFLGVVILVYSPGHVSHYAGQTEYYAMAALLLGSVMGLIFSASLLWLYIFWEMAAFAGWRLAGFFRSDRDVARAGKALLITSCGALCMLIGILLIYFDKGTLDLRFLKGGTVSMTAAVLILAGIFSRSANLPFSAWLPDAAAAPAAVTALLAAGLASTGVYAYARIFGATLAAPAEFSRLVPALAGLSALAAAGAALREKDLRRIIAYSTVSQTGFIFLGLASGNRTAFQGGLLYLLTHSIAQCGLFLCAGIVEQKTRTRDITRLGGLFRTMPVTGAAFALCSLSVMGIPPFGGFFGKFLVFTGAAQNGSPLVLTLFLAGALLTPLYLARLFHLVFLGEEKAQNSGEGAPLPVAVVLALALTGLALGALIYYPSVYAGALTAGLGVNLE